MFKLTERMAFSVGANFYNIFNHPNFDQPDTVSAMGRSARSSPRPRYLRAVRSVLRQPAFGTHHSVPGQAGVLVRLTLFRLGGSFPEPPFFCVPSIFNSWEVEVLFTS